MVPEVPQKEHVMYIRLEHIKEEALGRAFNVDLLTAGVAFVF